MSLPAKPRLRPLEIFPVGEGGETMVAMRDPEGFSPTVAISYPAAILATLLDGRRTLADVQTDFANQMGQQISLLEIEKFVDQLDEAALLDTPRFRTLWKQQVEEYLSAPVRPAAHAGGAYAGEPEELIGQLHELFTCSAGPGAPSGRVTNNSANGQLLGVLSPHIDLHRGGPAFAWAYKQIVDHGEYDLFVIFGTAHSGMNNLFSVSRKHFATPLGTAETDQEFIDNLATRLADGSAEGNNGAKTSRKRRNGHQDNNDDDGLLIFDDEMAHRNEHSIEFQVLFLQYLLRPRQPKIVPILVGSFHEYLSRGEKPTAAAEFDRFVAALRETAAQYKGRVFYISGGDLAHVGRRFGDSWKLDAERLEAQGLDDRQLLAGACSGDSAKFFEHVAQCDDRSRICGLAPTYTMMEVMRPRRGELLKYDQAVEPDGSSCVSFASVAFYGD